MNGNWLLGCRSLEGRKRLWTELCKEVMKGYNFTITYNMLLNFCNSLGERVLGVNVLHVAAGKGLF